MFRNGLSFKRFFAAFHTIGSQIDILRAINDDVIMRTIIDLTAEQVRALATLCESQKISRAEAVRRAVARYVAEEQRPGRERAFGAWKGKRTDSVALIRRLRDEWKP